MADRTEAQAAADLAVAASAADFLPDNRGQFAVLPTGYSVADLEQYQTAPNRIRGSHKFVETTSLAAYVNRFTGPGTMLAADFATARIVATLDGSAPDAPGFSAHVASYQAAMDDRLKAWLGMTGGPLSQAKLGRFLESRAVDVQKPDAASVMEMVMTFDAVKKVSFRSAQRLHDGQRQLLYVEENEAKGSVTIPDHFILFLPIYRGLDPQPVKFWLRYRIEEGSLAFTLEMHDKDEVLRAAFQKCVDQFRVDLKADAFIYVIG
jgi:uncharacterized protein YfdQ (DUF2303 family)